MSNFAVKAVGDWLIDVLGVPFGSPSNKDGHGDYFTAATKFHEDKYPLPPAVYYHGYRQASPVYLGPSISRSVKSDGIWYRVKLDKAVPEAVKVWDAAKVGMARASSGSVPHLTRKAKDGAVLEWPVVELSVFDTYQGKLPANSYAVVLPVLKSIYLKAGISLPEGLTGADDTKATPTGALAQSGVAAGGSSVVAVTQQQEGRMELTEEVKSAILDAVKAGFTAQQDAAAEAQRQAEARQAEVEAVVKAERAKWEADAAKARRLPDDFGVPTMRQYAYADKFDGLDAADQAFMISVLKSHKRAGGEGKDGRDGGPSEAAYKALAIKLGEDKGVAGEAGQAAMKALGIPDATKANELNRSDLAGFGDEWVGIAYSAALWEKIREDTWVLNELPTIEIPQGMESINIPLEGADPTFYKVTRAADEAASGHPNATVPSSKVGTAKQPLTVGKMGARVSWEGDLDEDSLIPFAPQVRQQTQTAGSEQLEHLIIDGDTDVSATTNINLINGTPGGSELYTLFNGFRKLALITNTANARDGAALAVEDFLETFNLMGVNGINASNKTKVLGIIDPRTNQKALQLAEVKTRDVFSNPTIEDGLLMKIWGYRIKVSWQLARLGNGLTNAAGKVDQSSSGVNNTKGQILTIRPDQWRFAFKRRWTTELVRIAHADSWEIVTLARVGMIYRDTEAAAISYNITV